MFETQRQNILMRYSLSPRSIRGQYQNFQSQRYSWKAYLSPDVHLLYTKIKKNQNYIPFYQPNIPYQSKTIFATERNRINTQGRDSSRTEKQNWVSTCQFVKRPSNDFKSTKNTCSTCSETKSKFFIQSQRTRMLTTLSNESQNNNSIREYYQSLKLNDNKNTNKKKGRQFRQSNRIQQTKDTKQNKYKNEITNRLTKQTGMSTDEISWYHVQLKDEQRRYLLNKFTEHLEQKHNLKF